MPQAPPWSAVGRVRAPAPMDGCCAWLLIGGQVALSVTALFGAGLFLRSLHNLQSIDTGFDSRLGPAGLDRPVPEPAAAAGTAGRVPPTRSRGSARCLVFRSQRWPTSRPIEAAAERTLALEVRGADGSIQLAAGHAPGLGGSAVLRGDEDPHAIGAGLHLDSDAMNMPRVAIVNDTFARQHFGDRSALGRPQFGGDGAPYEIVGVVGDAKYMDLRQQVPPTVYLHAFQRDRMSGAARDPQRGESGAPRWPRCGRRLRAAALDRPAVTGVRTLDAVRSTRRSRASGCSPP